jgi:hypothetical protein
VIKVVGTSFDGHTSMRTLVLAAIAAVTWFDTLALADPTKITIEDDPYAPGVWYEAAPYKHATETWWLVGAKMKQEPHEMNVAVGFLSVYTEADWRDFNSAGMQGGIVLKYERSQQQVTDCREGKCIYAEQGLITLSLDQLRNAAESGLDIKVYAKNGDDPIIKIPAADVAEFVKAMGL